MASERRRHPRSEQCENYSQRATLYVYGQQGTLIDYGFGFTSSSVAANGGFVTNHANPGVYDGLVLTGDGGTYGANLPPANQLTNTVGIGSLDLSTGALSTDPAGPTSGAGILNFSDIAGNGGLTLETWVKGGTGSGLIISVADTYVLAATASGVQFAVDAFNLSANADMTQWHQVAGVLRNATLSSGVLHGDLSLYLDGVLQGTVTNATTGNDRQRATAVGNHTLVNSPPYYIDTPFTGVVYEPRITLGALAPNQFTVVPPQVIITITNQPKSVYGLPGATATVTVGASVTGASLADLRYQWQQNGTDIVGATTTSYTTPTLVAGATDTYRCQITVVGSSYTVLSSVATVQVANQSGTIVRYGFAYTNNSVAANGTVTNDAIAGLYDGSVLGGDGGTYTNDLPPASLLQHTTGTGSLDLSTGSITTDPTGATSGAGILNLTDILANGGLTLETWVKGPIGANRSEAIMTVAGEYALLADTNGTIWVVNGFKGGTDFVEAPVDLSQWHHIAGVYSDPTKPGSDLLCNLNLYVDGVLMGTFTNSDFLTLDLQRGFSVGNHPLLNSLLIDTPFPGLVYEPRVTLGALTPAQFTIKVATPPTFISFGPHSGNSFPLTFSGLAGQTYKVLASTDAALPIGSWSTLSSGTFGASPVTYTDATASTAHKFYRIVSP
ncbi:MAG: hypothetical protein NT154_34265 [Verrucomicrobia bacterium]|nr:hypothetical protein [Verrucomicrobiota bacterium]